MDVDTAWYWAAHSGGELDLLLEIDGMRIGIEIKLSEAPKVSASMHRLCDLLELDYLFVVSRTLRTYSASDKIHVLAIEDINRLREIIALSAVD